MSWYIFDNLSTFQEFDKKYCFNGMKWTAQNRFGADNTLLNINTNTKNNYSELNYETFSMSDYPLFGRKSGILNKTDGFTTSGHKAKQGTDGKYYCEKQSDYTIPELLDEDDNVIRPALTIPRETEFYNGCVSDGTTENEPEWMGE